MLYFCDNIKNTNHVFLDLFSDIRRQIAQSEDIVILSELENR